jgi:putative endonuclease
MTEQVDAGGTRSLGQYGERLAARYLGDRGMQVLERNWRCEHGEIDLIALDGDCLVVCEVKTRRSTAFGEPVEAVTWRKAARLRRLASAWLAAHDVRPDGVRIDVIGILRPANGPAALRHLRGVG